MADSAFVSLRLPAEFTERPRDSGAREWTSGGDHQQYILTGFIASSSPAASLGRVPSPGMMEMSQCVDSINGREVLVQAWRTRGGTFRDHQRMDRFDVFAVVPVNAELRFYLTSGSYLRETQDLALAVVRTVSVATAPPPPD